MFRPRKWLGSQSSGECTGVNEVLPSEGRRISTDQFGGGHTEAEPFSEAKCLTVSPLEAGDRPMRSSPGWNVIILPAQRIGPEEEETSLRRVRE